MNKGEEKETERMSRKQGRIRKIKRSRISLNVILKGNKLQGNERHVTSVKCHTLSMLTSLLCASYISIDKLV